MLIKTEESNVYRDLASKALIVTDSRAKEEYRRKMREKKEVEDLKENVQELKASIEEINIIKNEISEIKQLILSLTNKVN
jgi:uncharacterized protein YlxW (UPF0749 family)